MAFGFAGAAQGVQNTLTLEEVLAQKRAAFLMAQQKEAFDQQQAQQSAQQNEAARAAQLDLQNRQLASTERNRDEQRNQAGSVEMRRIETQAKQEQGRKTVAELFRRGAPRNEILGALADSGENITGALMNDPQNSIDAANARAEAANQTRLLAAGMAHQGGANADLDRQLKQMKVEGEQQKQEQAASADKAKSDAIGHYKSDIRSTINELIDANGNLKPDAAAVVGPFDALTPTIRGASNTALAKLNHLISLISIEKLREMKAQSRTGASGLGALSGKELDLLTSAGSTLGNRKQDEAAYARQLKAILDGLETGYQVVSND